MTTRHRALIVEDDEATVEDLAEILSSIGCEHVKRTGIVGDRIR